MAHKALERLGDYYSTHLPVDPFRVENDTVPQWRVRAEASKEVVVVGGDEASTRAWTHPHPNVRYMPLRFPGRGIELGTMKQYRLWIYLARQLADLEQGKYIRTSLEELAKRCDLSRSAVSRFLEKLFLWRAIDLLALRGRKGAIYIWHSPSVARERDMWGGTPPLLMRKGKRLMLKHRLWQERFERWLARIEEMRYELKHWWQAREDMPKRKSSATLNEI